jgi:hypothetical protein
MLTGMEKDILEQVETSVEDAEQIKERNTNLLAIIRGLRKMSMRSYFFFDIPCISSLKVAKYKEYNTIEINIPFGCPHCMIDCTMCAWAIDDLYFEEDDPRYVEDFSEQFCFMAEFGGTRLADVWGWNKYWNLQYGKGHATIKFRQRYEPSESPSIEEKYIENEEFHRLENFLLGHIEWADIVLGEKT